MIDYPEGYRVYAVPVTYDVDVIVEAASLLDYHKLSEKLRSHNFSEDLSSDALICRWRSGETILDVMPTHSDIFGFGNQWYAAAYSAAISVSLPSGKLIRVLPPDKASQSRLPIILNRIDSISKL